MSKGQLLVFCLAQRCVKGFNWLRGCNGPMTFLDHVQTKRSASVFSVLPGCARSSGFLVPRGGCARVLLSVGLSIHEQLNLGFANPPGGVDTLQVKGRNSRCISLSLGHGPPHGLGSLTASPSPGCPGHTSYPPIPGFGPVKAP